MNQKQLSRVILAPVISEKSTLAAEKGAAVVFRVLPEAEKDQIRRAVELMFKVEVDSVRVLNVKGKNKRTGRFIGKRSDWKKAYVKLKPGHDINFGTA
ncbi:50S ribosomal protein L23 [Methylogaea oryzae]|uniref:Large ribosomal subunit protein uL23 n=1 Tax=Methylogaea oryzae TaxID=1295382 RepID=A0A8D5AII7_9GAMM|nr:50S ribosomal protein L23 [Methylogaea oryzae]BBL69779.1 50S ribosomal protein L23 [Methylogaea oryzae]